MIKKAILIFLRYILPGLATVTGILAWFFASTIAEQDLREVILEPDASSSPVTIQIELPEIPSFEDSPSGNEPVGDADCTEDSNTSNSAIRCSSSDIVLDPCYLPPEPSPGSVFCFDPVTYTYDVYTLNELSQIFAAESGPEATFILVDMTDERDIFDYPEEAIEVRGRTVDVCTLDDKFAEGSDISYSCVTGSKVTGPIYGDSPNHFVEYKEIGEDDLKSKYLSYIIYG